MNPNQTPIELFVHQLNTKFSINDEKEAYLNEVWSHFHKIMCEYNNQWIQNQIYLDENFTNLWNTSENPKHILERIVEHMVQSNINNVDKEV